MPEPEGSEYVRWVQTMLNQALNLQLSVDGVMNVQTRSAIRGFQKKNGLLVTGIIGPDTERAFQSVSTRDSAASVEPPSSAVEPVAIRQAAGDDAKGSDSELFELWQDESGQGGDTFAVLATGTSAPFKDWVWPMPVWNGRKPVMSNGFNPRPGNEAGMTHPGVDILYVRRPNEPAKLPEGSKGFFVPSNRIPVYAVASGIVIQSGKNKLGHSVIIDHGNGYTTFYQHLTAQGLPAKSAHVTAGMPIGYVGHNPAGYRLNHLHFEIWPGRDRQRAIDPYPILMGLIRRANITPTAPGRSAKTPGSFIDTLRRGMWSGMIRQTIQSGVRDENRLTDMVFNALHPELQGRRLRADERSLLQEWLSIRDGVVRPELRAPAAPGTPSAPAPSAPAPTAGAWVSDSEVRQTLAMAARKAPGLGVTLEELLLRHKADFGDLPIDVLLAFIVKEAGTHLFDDATAGYWDKKSQKYVPQPKFFELGVFQTPAGLHGCTPDNGSRKCAYAPPGINVEGSQFGKGWYRLTGKYPTKENWRDPTMQVRIGLWDLNSTGERVAGDFPELFPSRSSEWYLRMAVLYSFSKGAGWTRAYLNRYKMELLALPENQRWNFLRDKPAARKDPYSGRTIVKPKFDPENVDKKWALATKLRAVRRAPN